MGCAVAGRKFRATDMSKKVDPVVLLKHETRRVSVKASRETDGRNSGRVEIGTEN